MQAVHGHAAPPEQSVHVPFTNTAPDAQVVQPPGAATLHCVHVPLTSTKDASLHAVQVFAPAHVAHDDRHDEHGSSSWRVQPRWYDPEGHDVSSVQFATTMLA